MTTVEIGEAVGMSGPALYKHFRSKDAAAGGAAPTRASERLLQGAREILGAGPVTDAAAARAALDELIAFHIGFATAWPRTSSASRIGSWPDSTRRPTNAYGGRNANTCRTGTPCSPRPFLA